MAWGHKVRILLASLSLNRWSNVFKRMEISVKQNFADWFFRLSDDAIKYLAAQHNLTNIGSEQTEWTDRIETCRIWLFEQCHTVMNEEDEVPKRTNKWTKLCQEASVQKGKVCLHENIAFTCNLKFVKLSGIKTRGMQSGSSIS